MSQAPLHIAFAKRFAGWKSARRKKLLLAFADEYGTRGCPADWMDFCEHEFQRFLRVEISARAYL